jgi:hypothetical protein
MRALMKMKMKMNSLPSLVTNDWMRGDAVAVANVPVKATSTQVKLRKG